MTMLVIALLALAQDACPGDCACPVKVGEVHTDLGLVCDCGGDLTYPCHHAKLCKNCAEKNDACTFCGKRAVDLLIRVEAGNWEKKIDGVVRRWARWEIRRAKGSDRAVVEFRLPLKKSRDEIRRGELDKDALARALEELKLGLFKLEDGERCKCDAPRYTVTAREGDTRHSFSYGHSHDDHDQQQKLIDRIVALVEQHVSKKEDK